jgi:hypothetical protein
LTGGNGKLLLFGAFQKDFGRDFNDAVVPDSATAAYKAPVKWVWKRGARMDKWTKDMLRVMQEADLEV